MPDGSDMSIPHLSHISSIPTEPLSHLLCVTFIVGITYSWYATLNVEILIICFALCCLLNMRHIVICVSCTLLGLVLLLVLAPMCIA